MKLHNARHVIFYNCALPQVIMRSQVNRTFGDQLEVGVRVERHLLDGTHNINS